MQGVKRKEVIKDNNKDTILQDIECKRKSGLTGELWLPFCTCEQDIKKGFQVAENVSRSGDKTDNKRYQKLETSEASILDKQMICSLQNIFIYSLPGLLRTFTR